MQYTKQRVAGGAFALLALLFSAPALPQSTLQDCAAITNDQARLACFDGLTRSTAPTPAAPAPAPSAPPPVVPVVREEPAVAPSVQAEKADTRFGLEERIALEEAPADLVAKVTAARHSDFTGWTIELDNGQIWKQIGTDRFQVMEGEAYVISRGILNSFLMRRQGYNQTIRVTRIE